MPAEAEDAANLPQASDARERAHHDHRVEDGSNPADRLAAALDGDDDVNDSELEAVDHALASITLHEDLPGAGSMGKGRALMSLDEARAKLSPDILKALADQFKGSLTQMRHLDERDQIF